MHAASNTPVSRRSRGRALAPALFVALALALPCRAAPVGAPKPVALAEAGSASLGPGVFDFQLGVWRVAGRRADGRGGWKEYRAWLRVEPSHLGGWPALVERWYTHPGSWERAPDLGSSFRVWDPERREWVARMLDSPTRRDWQWPPFIWPEISTWARDGAGLAMPARAHNDMISNHTDTAAIAIDGDGGWTLRATRQREGGAALEWERLAAEPVSTERGIWSQGVGLAGRVSTVIDSHTGSRGLALDPEGNLYIGAVLDGGSDDDIPVLKRTPAGEVSIYAQGLVRTAGLAWADGALYAKAHDVEGGRLVRIGSDGTIHHVANVRGDSLAADARGNAYTVDWKVPQVLRVTPEGEVTVLSQHPDLPGALGMAFHERSRTLFVADWATGEIHSIQTHGENTGHTRLHATVPGIATGSASWLAASDEWVYAAGFGQEQIFRVSVADGRVEWVAGSGLPGHADGPVAEARFRSPNGIAVSPDGNTVWVSDLGWMRDRKYPQGALRRIDLSPPTEP